MKYWSAHLLSGLLYVAAILLTIGGLSFVDRREGVFAGVSCLALAFGVIVFASLLPAVRELLDRASEFLKSRSGGSGRV